MLKIIMRDRLIILELLLLCKTTNKNTLKGCTLWELADTTKVGKTEIKNM